MTDAVCGKYLLRLSALGAVLLAMAELTVRLIPACEVPYATFDRQHAMMKYDPNLKRTGYMTAGNLAQRKTFWSINNMGWNSPCDYRSDGGRPILAVIGNSYVEGLIVDVDKGLAPSLQARLGGAFDCYGFGYSGSTLSQYLNISRYVKDVFHPSVLVFIVLERDLANSLYPSDKAPESTLLFKESPAGLVEVPIHAYVPSRIKRWYGNLALGRYLSLNKQSGFADPPSRSEHMSQGEIDKVTRIADYTFRKIREENPDTPVLVVVDAPRRELYRGRIPDRPLQARAILARTARKYDVHMLDLTGVMTDLYRRNHVRFSFTNDHHWNGYGFAVVTAEIGRYLAAHGLLEAGARRAHQDR